MQFCATVRYNFVCLMVKKLIVIGAASVAACMLPLFGCGPQYARYSQSFYSLGSYATIVLEGDFYSREDSVIADAEGVADIIDTYENAVSTTIPASDISIFNAAEAGSTVKLSAAAYEVLSLALEMYEETGGCYNAGVYYSVDLYGFSGRSEDEEMPYDRDEPDEELPEEQYISAFQQLSQSFPEIELYEEGGEYFAVKPEKTVTVEGITYSLAIDLSGIVKGYIADKVDAYIDELGYEYGYFSFGGTNSRGGSSIMFNAALGSDDGRWTLNMLDPRGGSSDYYLTVSLRDAALSISGDYQNYYEIDGVRYCHIIDPATGSPVQTGIIDASCMGGTAAEADARTTAIMAMGLDGAIEYINSETVRDEGLKISFVYRNSAGEYLLITNMAEDDYQITNDKYVLASSVNESGEVVFTGTK